MESLPGAVRVEADTSVARSMTLIDWDEYELYTADQDGTQSAQCLELRHAIISDGGWRPSPHESKCYAGY